MTNLLRLAAERDDVADAADSLCRALGIEIGPVARRALPEQYRWVKFCPESRLEQIGHWLLAEARAQMVLVPARDPNDSVGTRD